MGYHEGLQVVNQVMHQQSAQVAWSNEFGGQWHGNYGRLPVSQPIYGASGSNGQWHGNYGHPVASGSGELGVNHKLYPRTKTVWRRRQKRADGSRRTFKLTYV